MSIEYCLAFRCELSDTCIYKVDPSGVTHRASFQPSNCGEMCPHYFSKNDLPPEQDE